MWPGCKGVLCYIYSQKNLTGGPGMSSPFSFSNDSVRSTYFLSTPGLMRDTILGNKYTRSLSLPYPFSLPQPPSLLLPPSLIFSTSEEVFFYVQALWVHKSFSLHTQPYSEWVCVLSAWRSRMRSKMKDQIMCTLLQQLGEIVSMSCSCHLVCPIWSTGYSWQMNWATHRESHIPRKALWYRITFPYSLSLPLHVYRSTL